MREMAYKYETKNCRNCEHCVKTDNGLYCSHREGHPKVTSGGWCIDMQEKTKGNLNNDMMPVDTTVNISPEDIKWELKGDLISRKELKRSMEILFKYGGYDSGLVMNTIDNVPAVQIQPEYFPPCEDCNKKMEEIRRAYDKMKAMETTQGEWIDCSEDYGYVECPFCEHLTTCEGNIDELHYCWNCGAKLGKDGVE